ncbi:hypothetical protein ACET3X_005332 [Alternaria dauci]|uniref:Uncharacterized protein n=1 Tax=Alternaria dauci TaxID=48095 RepID=A0ABR3UK05_9PLEO
MTSHARQDARQKAGKSQGKNHGYGCGKTTTSQHARSDAKKKEAYEEYKTLIGWDDLLPWQQDNEFILTSHRRATFSYLRSLKSVLEVHNETVNIWSHILGTAVFFCIAAVLYFSTLQSCVGKGSTNGDDGAIYVYFSSVIACFFLSSM